MNPNDFLKENGRIAKLLPGYEFRPQQLKMANEISQAFDNSESLLIEAGTGVGKSFAYLIPAALWAKKTSERVVISTQTINLQEQLINKDIPFLNTLPGINVNACLAKGKGHYLCLRKLFGVTDRNSMYLDMFKEQDFALARKIERWFSSGEGDGTKNSLDFVVPDRVWNLLRVETESCSGRKCRYYDNCPYFIERKKWEESDLLIINHSLFFTDASLRKDEVPFLPGYGAVIFDEAHSLEDIASNHMGISISKRMCLYQLRKIYEKKGVGLFSRSHYQQLQALSMEFKTALEDYFLPISKFREKGQSRIRKANAFPDIRNNVCEAFLQELEAVVKSIEDDPDFRVEAGGLLKRMRDIIASISIFQNCSAEGSVYWIDGRPEDPRIMVTPIRIDKHLQNYVWNEEVPHILTSATLATRGARNGCEYIRGRLGLSEAREIVLGSPFDFNNQAAIYIPEDMPDPSRGTPEFRKGLTKYILHFVQKSKGRAFILFTSLADMRYVNEQLNDEFVKMGLLVLVQDGSLTRNKMLELFREDGNAVLMGVSSFWQGVDVRGEALSNVTIARLPFEVPNQPIVEARCEEITARGKSAFMEYSLPNAILKLKQGFGRLIRTKEDTGFVAILDPRIISKRYGRMFLSALPQCPVYRKPHQM